MTATSYGDYIHPCSSMRRREKVVFLSHWAEALSLTVVGLIWAGQEHPCTDWLRSAAFPPLPESVSVRYNRGNCAGQGPPWDWGGINLTQMCGCYKVPVGWLPKGELLGTRRRSLLLDIPPTNPAILPWHLVHCTKIIYVSLSNSSEFWWSPLYHFFFDCAFSIVSIDL